MDKKKLMLISFSTMIAGCVLFGYLTIKYRIPADDLENSIGTILLAVFILIIVIRFLVKLTKRVIAMFNKEKV